MATASAWGALESSLLSRIAELKKYSHLRVEDRSAHQFDQELRGLEASVRAVEGSVRAIRAHLANENAMVTKVEAIIEASSLQGKDLSLISSHLPQHLPVLQAGPSLGMSSQVSMTNRRDQSGEPSASTSAAHSIADPAGNTSRRERSTCAPRSYVTESELAGLSSYMRGRLTLDKVNAALDELATCSEANSRLMAAARAASSRLTGAERKRAVELFHSVASKDGIKGRFWFLDSDLRDGVNIKPDKTGKSILTVLRHLKRLEEVRCTVEGTSVVAYVFS